MDEQALADIAAHLYGLRPEEFTRARDEEARKARADGDRVGAKAVAALRRPSLAAWLVNMLVRERGDEIEQLLQLGTALAAAQRGLAGQELRALGRQRQQLLAAVARQARALARDLGHPVSEDVTQEVEQTLGAAMADPQVAAAVRSGRLTSPTSYAGLGLPEADTPPRRHLVAVPPPDAVTPAAPARADGASGGRAAKQPSREQTSREHSSREERERLEEQRRQEEQRRREEERRRREEERRAAELAQAREEERETTEALAAAQETARAAQARLEDAEHAVADTRRRIDDLQEQLRRAEADLVTATKDERTLRRERDAAARVSDLAERSARRARERVERLETPD